MYPHLPTFVTCDEIIMIQHFDFSKLGQKLKSRSKGKSFSVNNQGVFVKHYAPVGNKVQKAILISRTKSRSQGHLPWCHLKGLH